MGDVRMIDRFVVDNSVVMSWCFVDESNSYSDSILELLKNSEVLVPSIWPLEVGNVLLVAERNKRLSGADSARFIALLNELPIIVDQELPERMLKEIFALAREYHISTYDASYLDLAMRRGLHIATNDKSMVRVAKKSKVPIIKK